MIEKVLTAEEQAALSPDDIVKRLKRGNLRFTKNKLSERNYPAQVSKSILGQFPQAFILSCIDSRVPVTGVFDQGIGDVFVARIAGNIINEDILGSMELSCRLSGSKLVVVLGHERCGAVKAAIDNVKMGNITPMLAKIRPAIEMASGYTGKKVSKNEEFVYQVCECNVKNTIDEIRLKSPILKEMEDDGELKIVGAIYNMTTGTVEFMNL
jgi:carbonic anhydrase